MKNVLKNIMYPIIVIAFIIIVWFIASLIIDVSLILPSPFKAFSSLINYFKEVSLYKALLFTIIRASLALLISFVVALGLSVLSIVSTKAKKIITPVVSIMRLIPTMSIILILILWMKPTFTPVIVAMLVLIPLLYSEFNSSVLMIDNKLIEMASLYNVSKTKQLKMLYYPLMKESIFLSISSGIAFSLKLVIAAEALALCRDSIGGMMQNDKIWLEVESLFALTILTVIVGGLLELTIKFIGKKVGGMK